MAFRSLVRWKSEGRALEAGPVTHPSRLFRAREPAQEKVASLEKVRRALTTQAAQVVDARSAERFHGRAPEPRPGLRAGHMPGALNVPYGDMLENGSLASSEKIRAAFVAGGVDLDRPIITSCGSGVTACALAFALHLIGRPDVAVYDGSWSEWGLPGDTPVETGPAR